jgi:hypothetical protein
MKSAASLLCSQDPTLSHMKPISSLILLNPATQYTQPKWSHVTKTNITRITVCVRNYKTMLNKCTSLSTLTCHITLQYFYVHSNQTLYYIDYSLSLLPTYFTMPSDHTHSTPMVNRVDFIHITFSINNISFQHPLVDRMVE